MTVMMECESCLVRHPYMAMTIVVLENEPFMVCDRCR